TGLTSHHDGHEPVRKPGVRAEEGRLVLPGAVDVLRVVPVTFAFHAVLRLELGDVRLGVKQVPAPAVEGGGADAQHLKAIGQSGSEKRVQIGVRLRHGGQASVYRNTESPNSEHSA